MAEIDPRAIAKQLAAAVNAHDVDRIAALFDEQRGRISDTAQSQIRNIYAPRPRGQGQAQWWPRGPEGIARYFRTWLAALPDLQMILYGIVAGGDQAALEFTFQGTHQGAFLGLPASGSRVGCQGVAVFQFWNGKILEMRLYYDLATVQRQMGGVIVLEEARA